MLRWSINLFRVRGIQIAVHGSFFALLAWAAWDGSNDRGAEGSLWAMAVLVAFFGCIVLHELGHSFTAMHFGVGVQRILLMPIGGMAEFDSIPRSPRQELLITVAGPAVNFAIAAVLWLGHAWWREPMFTTPANLRELAYELMVGNLYLGVFNLTPAFPMDGGRIVRALLAYRVPYARATFWAATLGKGVAVVAVGFALFYHAWLLAALFLFILVVGELEYRAVLVRERQDAEWALVEERLRNLHHTP